MTRTRWFLAFLLMLANLPVFAQKADEEAALEKQRRQAILADSIIAESRELRLPENRALIYAKIGSRIWDLDRKRAEDLFQDAITELLAAQAEAEQERLRGRHSELLTGQNTRPQVLQAIANRNAEFALQSLYRTRPIAIERAIAGVNARDKTKIRNSAGGDTYLIHNELSLEQNFARQAADQNPEKTVALLRAVMKKGITGEALSLLRKIHEKDPAAATELGSEVTSQLLRKSFMTANRLDYSALQVSFSFLNDHIRQRPASEKTFRFASAEMRSLADKLISFLLDRNNHEALPYAPQMVPIAEKMRPDSVEKLKELGNNRYLRNGFHAYAPDPEVTRLLNGETPVEEMLAAAPKLPVEHRSQVYQNAASRLVAGGDVARARQVINDNFSEDALTSAQESLNWSYVHQLINHGKYAEAEVLINEFPENNRLSAMISLAIAVYHKNPEENKTQSVGILNKAAAGLPAKPETSNEMQQMIQLISAYTQIEPADAFRIFDALVPQMNEIAEASAVVSGFQGNHNFRRGEMLITNGNSFGVHIDGSMFRALAQKDFDRTLALIGAFSRREMRIALKQQLLESV